MSDFAEMVAIGIVQTTVDARNAWPADVAQPRMSDVQDEHVWLEICKAMRAFQDGVLKPRFVVFPELSLPRTRLDEFGQLVGALNVIAIVGADYRLDHGGNTAQNQGIVFVPRGFFRDRPSRYCTQIVFGKTYGAPKEIANLGRLVPPWTFRGDQNVYVFDCEQYGRFGVSICYDFMDIERALMYRGRIQHLVVLAYNRDLEMFRSLADSLSRTVYCNVVICNTGYFGGSVAVSPYYEAYRRTLYSHDGAGLFTTQVVQLPVHGLAQAVNGEIRARETRKTVQEFKHPPPGVPVAAAHALRQVQVSQSCGEEPAP